MTQSGEWPLRVMLYGAGQAINGINELDTQIQAQLAGLSRVATNRFVAAVAQLDSTATPSVRYVLDPLNRQPVTQIPDFNAGDPQQLLDFVQWSAQICPARRSIIVLSGHGSAWQDNLAEQVLGTRGLSLPPSMNRTGAAHHTRSFFGGGITRQRNVVRALLVDGSDRDYLSNSELGAVCENAAGILGSPIDVLVFDACLMSSWEILLEVSPCVRTAVASVDELSAAGVDLGSPVAVMTQNQGQLSATQMAGTIVQQFQPRASFDTCIAIDFSTSQWLMALDSFRTFCGALLPWVRSSPANATAARNALRLAATSVVQYWSGGLADVSALAAALESVPGAPTAGLQALRDAESALRTCVIAKSVGSDYAGGLGISIFSPNSTTNYATNRSDYVRLQFSSRTGWGDVLDALYADQGTLARFVRSPASDQSQNNLYERSPDGRSKQHARRSPPK